MAERPLESTKTGKSTSPACGCSSRSFLSLVAVLILVAFEGIAQQSPHGKIRFGCATCHTTENWAATLEHFKHEATGFALTGRHAALKCESCHAGLQMANRKSASCISCHTDIHKGELGANCLRCHSTQAWKITDMVPKHHVTRFPLLGKHATLACQTCHINASQRQFAGTPTDCFGCHRNDFARAKAPNHTAAGFSTNCVQCHQVNAFRWGTGFDHARTEFPLLGAHAATSCFSCHKNQVFKSTTKQCVACHQMDYNSATNPNHVTGRFPTECQSCHTQIAFRPATFHHSATGFPLTGAHVATACNLCHVNNQYTSTPANCVDCHRTDYTNAVNPRHQGGAFTTNCVQCHTTNPGWRPASFDHNTTQLPLTGRHSTTQCVQCHTNNNYQLAFNNNCFQCHQAQYNQPTNPRHVLPSFAYNCTPCHTTSVWRPSSFNHGNTRFPLTGRHVGRGCNDCHRNNVYQNLPSTCWDCHENDYRNATDPNHVQRNLSHDCTQCHSTSGWGGASFDHNTTRFPLTGRHATTQCALCHVSGNYQLQYTNCYPCHTTQYNQPTNPRHVSPSFVYDCTPCHSTSAWRPSTFSHGGTAFPLVGAHQSVACANCHVNNQYQLPHTCWDCHQTRFNQTTNPNHQQGQFSRDCTQCHTQSAWTPASFDHGSTAFPLTGAHIPLQCVQCHANGNYQLVFNNNCRQCHEADYNQPTNPRHVLPSFGQNCSPCHNTTVWRPSTFSHANTNYQLTGAHQATACNQCHVNNIYRGTPTTCLGCHQSDFNNTTNPNHVAGNFSQNCTSCHTTAAWRPASFDHSITSFPLTGAHITTPCIQCHVNNNYNLRYTDCYQCHATDYARPTNPNHVQWQLNHNCTPCHTTTAWRPSAFNHDAQFFRIYSGHHNGRWNNNCASCHPSIGQYQIFTCTTACHPRAEMDAQHRNRPGYQYESSQCYSCHRNS